MNYSTLKISDRSCLQKDNHPNKVLNLPSVSIVCVTYNRKNYILRCLESCLQQDYSNLEIVVVVNPSGDGTEEAIQKQYPQINLIYTHCNLGFFPALNLAIANTKGDYIMTVDDDAYFMSSSAISDMVQAFEKEPNLGAITCNIEGPYEGDLNTQDRYIRVFKTGFTMLPKQVFTEWVGFYPDLFFRSAGETYVCTALWNLKKPVKCLSQVRMYHDRTMQGRSDKDWKFYGLRSQILCSVMREPIYLLIPSLISKCCKSLFLFIKWGHFITWIETWISSFIHIPYAFNLRRPISWRTTKLLRKLDRNIISDISLIDPELLD